MWSFYNQWSLIFLHFLSHCDQDLYTHTKTIFLKLIYKPNILWRSIVITSTIWLPTGCPPLSSSRILNSPSETICPPCFTIVIRFFYIYPYSFSQVWISCQPMYLFLFAFCKDTYCALEGTSICSMVTWCNNAFISVNKTISIKLTSESNMTHLTFEILLEVQ